MKKAHFSLWSLAIFLFFNCQQQNPQSVKKPQNLETPLQKTESAPKPIQYFAKNIDQLKTRQNGCFYLETMDEKQVWVHPDSIFDLRFADDGDDTRFPVEVFTMKNLKILWLGMRGFKAIPEGISQLQKLELIDFQHGMLQKLPNDFCKLKNLKTAVFLFSDLRSLPECFGELENLEELHLGRTSIQKLPESMKNLQKLKSLIIAGEPDQPHVSEKEFQRIKKWLPNCRIIYRISKID